MSATVPLPKKLNLRLDFLLRKRAFAQSQCRQTWRLHRRPVSVALRPASVATWPKMFSPVQLVDQLVSLKDAGVLNFLDDFWSRIAALEPRPPPRRRRPRRPPRWPCWTAWSALSDVACGHGASTLRQITGRLRARLAGRARKPDTKACGAGGAPTLPPLPVRLLGQRRQPAEQPGLRLALRAGVSARSLIRLNTESIFLSPARARPVRRPSPLLSPKAAPLLLTALLMTRRQLLRPPTSAPRHGAAACLVADWAARRLYYATACFRLSKLHGFANESALNAPRGGSCYATMTLLPPSSDESRQPAVRGRSGPAGPRAALLPKAGGGGGSGGGGSSGNGNEQRMPHLLAALVFDSDSDTFVVATWLRMPEYARLDSTRHYKGAGPGLDTTGRGGVSLRISSTSRPSLYTCRSLLELAIVSDLSGVEMSANSQPDPPVPLRLQLAGQNSSEFIEGFLPMIMTRCPGSTASPCCVNAIGLRARDPHEGADAQSWPVATPRGTGCPGSSPP
uniref:Protein kinase domain-containing protein n=1 Tax=Macrostomum lignano TaxID=282301 RepID=A0A1I8FFS7_9PLAT